MADEKDALPENNDPQPTKPQQGKPIPPEAMEIINDIADQALVEASRLQKERRAAGTVPPVKDIHIIVDDKGRPPGRG